MDLFNYVTQKHSKFYKTLEDVSKKIKSYLIYRHWKLISNALVIITVEAFVFSE